MKKDGRKATNSDLDTIAEKSINVLKTSAINGNEKKNSAVDMPVLEFIHLYVWLSLILLF